MAPEERNSPLRAWMLTSRASRLIAILLVTSALLHPSIAFHFPAAPLLVENVALVSTQPVSCNRFLYNLLLSSLIEDKTMMTTGAPTSMPSKLDLGSIKRLEYDEVVRILDPNTVKLKRSGLASFAAVQTPSGYKSNFQFPDCMSKSPSSKVRQLLPAGCKVGVRFIDNDRNSSSRPHAALIITKDGALVNSELVRSGFAHPISRGREASEQALPGLTQQLVFLQLEAQSNEIGMYMNCDRQNTETMMASDDQFEPLEYTIQTQWTSDGGKPVLIQREGDMTQPANPGDTKGCSDFDYYEDALRWYERYAPSFGDVAKLDPDHDGVPCPGLPHTQDQSRYRMKVPIRQSP